MDSVRSISSVLDQHQDRSLHQHESGFGFGGLSQLDHAITTPVRRIDFSDGRDGGHGISSPNGDTYDTDQRRDIVYTTNNSFGGRIRLTIKREIGVVSQAIITSEGWTPPSIQLRKIFLGHWSRVLLLLIPVGLALHYCRQSPVTVFFINFAAMIPSITIMSLAIESILSLVGDLLGVLIATTFSNAALLITSVLLLRTRQLEVLRNSLVGAMLSNVMLMPGLAFLCGGYTYSVQHYNIAKTKTAGEMLLLAVLSLMIPSAADAFWIQTEEIVKISRGTAILLILCYGFLLFFQLRTHRRTLSEPSRRGARKGARPRRQIKKGDVAKSIANIGVRRAVTTQFDTELNDNRAEDAPELPLLTALVTLTTFTVLLAFNSLLATDSVQGLLLRLDLTPAFLGIVVLPIISNDPGSILVAIKDQQDRMVGMTLDRCVQIVLLVFPFIVLLGWMMGIDDLTLSFNAYETFIILTGVWTLNYVVNNGDSHWLAGMILVANFVIVSVSAYYYRP